MSSSILKTTIMLLDGKFKYLGTGRNDAKITVDYFPPYGDGEGFTSLELFLVSLSTCAGSSITMLLKKMNKDIKRFQVISEGDRREEHPTCFTKVTLNIEIETDAEEDDINKAIKMSEEKYCPVWAMIKGNVEVQIKVNRIKL